MRPMMRQNLRSVVPKVIDMKENLLLHGSNLKPSPGQTTTLGFASADYPRSPQEISQDFDVNDCNVI